MTASNVENEFETLKADLAKLRDDVANLTDAIKGVTSEAVREQVDTIRDRLDTLTGEATQRGRRTLDDLAEKIEERPLTSILIAFVVGLSFGRLLDR